MLGPRTKRDSSQVCKSGSNIENELIIYRPKKLKKNRITSVDPEKYDKIQNAFMIKILCKLGQAWWLTQVIPALWEAKAGESPEVRGSRPTWPTW